MEKVTVSKEVAEAIEEFLSDCVGRRTDEEMRGILVAEHCGQDWRKYEGGQYSALNDITTFELMRALVIGYQVEQTPEEKLREYYESWGGSPSALERKGGVIDTLDILGITIEGIND